MGLIEFYTTSLISTQLLLFNQLTSQVQSLKYIFTTNLAAYLILTIDIMDIVVQNNQLLSAGFTNWKIFLSSPNTTKVSSPPVSYGNCSCNAFDRSSYASTTVLISGASTESNVIRELLPGIVAGCYNLESLKKSTMALLFNQTAIGIILTQLNVDEKTMDDNITFIQVLNASELGLTHQINTSIGDLFTNLFVEEWCFHACAPASAPIR